MSRCRIDRNVLTDLSWRHWVVIIPFLTLHICGVLWAINVAAVLCVLATAFFLSRTRSLKAYPVQIRIAYLIWMMLGLLPYMNWMHWIQLIGTSAMVTVGYCPLARMLSLLPFNRSEPLTWSLLGRTFFRDPCAGGLLSWSAADAALSSCCSIRTPSIRATCSPAHLPVQKKLHASAH